MIRMIQQQLLPPQPLLKHIVFTSILFPICNILCGWTETGARHGGDFTHHTIKTARLPVRIEDRRREGLEALFHGKASVQEKRFCARRCYGRESYRA